MNNPDFNAWTKAFNAIAAERKLGPVDGAVQHFLYDDGLEPDEAAQPARISRLLKNDRPRPQSGSVADVIAARFGPTDPD